jgi:streptogramin lyase
VAVADLAVNHIRLVSVVPPAPTFDHSQPEGAPGRSLAVPGVTARPVAAEDAETFSNGPSKAVSAIDEAVGSGPMLYEIRSVCEVPHGVGRYVVADDQQQGILYATNEKDSAVWRLDCNTGELAWWAAYTLHMR